MTTHARKYTVKDLRALLDQRENAEKLIELINGEFGEKAQTEREETISRRIAYFLNAYVVPRRCGKVTIRERYIINEHDVYIPSVAFTKPTNTSELRSHMHINQPDLALEIVDSNQQRQYIDHKVKHYLRGGTRLVWVAYPDAQLIESYHLNDDGRALVHIQNRDHQLSGEPLLARFNIPVGLVFNSY